MPMVIWDGAEWTEFGYYVLPPGEPPGGYEESAWGTANVPMTPPLLTLSEIPWHGGPSYYEQFSKADAAGWSDPSFFPILMWYGRPTDEHSEILANAGINAYFATEDPEPGGDFTPATSRGISLIPFRNYYPELLEPDPMVVGWHIGDELDSGWGELTGTGGNEYDWLEFLEGRVEDVQDLEDGRFTQVNHGLGILRTWWSTGPHTEYETTMHGHVQSVDVNEFQWYSYTRLEIERVINGVDGNNSPDWPDDVQVAQRSYTYGWGADQVKRFQDPNNRQPIWISVETAMPFLQQGNPVYDPEDIRTIALDEIEGAVWSAIIHGASAICYFQHNDDGIHPMYSVVEDADIRQKVTEINTKIHSLAEVLNSPALYNRVRTVNGFDYYEYDFGNGCDARVIPFNGVDLYIFAGIGMRGDRGLGPRTFELPSDIVMPEEVEVVGESRTIPVIDGKFTDDFPFEYTHHVYRLPLNWEE